MRLMTFLFALLTAAGVHAAPSPVFIGFDAEAGHLTSTSDDAIRQGIAIAIDAINRGGGVLGGRPLELLEKDNRSVPARGVENMRAFAAVPDLVAVFTGKFSPVAIAQLPVIHEEQLILLDPWAAADGIIDHDYDPSYTFRLSLRDGWAMPALLERARRIGARRVGLILPRTAWGRSNHAAAERALGSMSGIELVGVEWHNWGDTTLVAHYEQLLRAGAEAVVIVVNENDGATLVREIAALPPNKRLPLVSHWGVTGGDFVRLCGDALQQVDLSVIQTFSFLNTSRPRAREVLDAAARLFGIDSAEQVLSPVGLAHAYDLTRLIARAIDQAGTTDRRRVRDALERLGVYDGLVKRYPEPFTPQRHEALAPSDLFFAVFRPDGVIVPIAERP